MLHFIWLNATLTTPFQPAFEIVYSLEGCALALFLILAPIAGMGISLATPLHRNFRIVLLLVVFHISIGTFSRLALIYHQLFSEDVHNNLLTIVSISRAFFFTFSMLLPLTVSVERFLATKWWEWYERQNRSTLAVFLACFLIIETGAIIPSFCVVFEVYSLPVQMTLFSVYLSTGTVTFFYLLNRNKASQLSLTARRITTRYTVAKHYQIKENLLVFGMLRKIAVPAVVWAIPAFVFFSVYLAIPIGVCDFIKLFSVALFDFHVSTYSLLILYRMCTCDRRLIRGMRRVPFIGKFIRRKARLETEMTSLSRIDQDEGSSYFAQLAGDLAGPKMKANK